MSIYMQVTGIDGNVTAEGLNGFIELESFNFDLKRRFNTVPGSTTDREGSKPSVSDVVVTKRVDKTSPKLFEEATTGAALDQIVIKFMNTGSTLAEYLTVTLYNVMVSTFDISDAVPQPTADGEAVHKRKPVETLAFNFDKVEVKYTPYDAKHQPGAPIPAGYDLKTAKKS